MNRRGFLEAMIKAGVACAALPAATQYVRNWAGLLVPRGTLDSEPPAPGWQRESGELAAHYSFGKDGKVSIQVTGPDGKKFGSLHEAAEYMMKNRKVHQSHVIELPGAQPRSIVTGFEIKEMVEPEINEFAFGPRHGMTVKIQYQGIVTDKVLERTLERRAKELGQWNKV